MKTLTLIILRHSSLIPKEQLARANKQTTKKVKNSNASLSFIMGLIAKNGNVYYAVPAIKRNLTKRTNLLQLRTALA